MSTKDKTSRFAPYSENNEKELCTKVSAKSTQSNTVFALNVFRSFCSAQGIMNNEVSLENLPDVLKKFFMCVRNEKGEYYKINSMRSLRSALQRHYLSVYNIDIVHDLMFADANIVFTNILTKIKQAGKGETEHHPEIEPEDMIKLFESFDVTHPIGLQEIVWFNIVYVFIRRGRQNIRQMTKDTFSVGTDASGARYIYQVGGELDKNHTINDSNHDTPGEGRIYETGGEKCPVRLLELYKSKLNPGNNGLWQRPRVLNSYVGQDVWYRNMPHGENYIGNMMAAMSQKYNLSQKYTNHCLRVTSLQKLDDSRVEGRHIIRVSGHKNVDSVKHYARKLSAEKQRKISGILTEYQKPCSSSSRDQESEVTGVSDLSNSNISDKQLAELPSNIIQNKENNLNVCGPMKFAPVLNSFSNITFNIHVNKTD